MRRTPKFLDVSKEQCVPSRIFFKMIFSFPKRVFQKVFFSKSVFLIFNLFLFLKSLAYRCYESRVYQLREIKLILFRKPPSRTRAIHFFAVVCAEFQVNFTDFHAFTSPLPTVFLSNLTQ